MRKPFLALFSTLPTLLIPCIYHTIPFLSVTACLTGCRLEYQTIGRDSKQIAILRHPVDLFCQKLRKIRLILSSAKKNQNFFDFFSSQNPDFSKNLRFFQFFQMDFVENFDTANLKFWKKVTFFCREHTFFIYPLKAFNFCCSRRKKYGRPGKEDSGNGSCAQVCGS